MLAGFWNLRCVVEGMNFLVIILVMAASFGIALLVQYGALKLIVDYVTTHRN